MALNGNLVWNTGEDELLCVTQWQLDEVWTTAGKPLSPPSTLSKPGKTYQERTGDQQPKEMRLATLLSMCPRERVDRTAALVSRQCADEVAHSDSH